MNSIGVLLMICGFLIAIFVGLPLRFKLENRMGSEDFRLNLKKARAAGDPQAIRLYFLGWVVGVMTAMGGLLLILTKNAA